jgi:nucleoside-diphosphate-sugar epimerase
MTILVTGNLGYVGSVLTTFLAKNGLQISGLDSGLFMNCTTDNIQDIRTNLKDIRDVEISDLNNIKSIIHLASLSNDPLGEVDQSVTHEINFNATSRLAMIAKNCGVKKFIFISTQSVYGYSSSNELLDELGPALNPQTAYAKSKRLAEEDLLNVAAKNFQIIILRPSTVFGWSPRLRTDIVFNNLLANGFFNKKIEIHSDGTPWRPVVHIKDLCRSIYFALLADFDKEIFNIGMMNGNYQIKELAEIAANSLNVKNIYFNTENIVDSRSYRVNFERAYSHLKFRANTSLETGAAEIIEKLVGGNFVKNDFLGARTTRLKHLNNLITEGVISDDLRFKRI